MTPPTLLTEWARLLLGSLRNAGLRRVVLSPGSRSTPFAWAALQDSGLECRTIIDERSAAFFAVGQARMTGEPTLLVCTSGSAAANYFPALVEAAESAIPLLVLTADRPLELQNAAAPQTIDQVKMFGDYARAYFELGTPDADPRMLRAIPRIAAQALLATRAPTPGPVHVNARARKPLEPREPDTADEHELRATVDRLLARARRTMPPEIRPAADAVRSLARACRDARRGLIVCGPAPAHRAASPAVVAELARATGFPFSAEAASQIRFATPGPDLQLDAIAALLEVPAFADDFAPDLILQVGRPPTASAWHGALDRWTDTERYVLTDHGWPDPSSGATGIVYGALDATIRDVVRALEGGGDPADTASSRGGGIPADSSDAAADRDGWRAELRRRSDHARGVIEDSLTGAFSEGAAVRAVVDSLPGGAVLALGNSLPIREVDLFVPAGERALTVWFQRGANGIDGLISGAAGAAAATARPTTLILGDVSFVHDIGGLRCARGLPAPLTIVVLNNGGGRIFERLPIVETLTDDPALDAWLTPPGVDFRAAAEAFQLPFARAEDCESIERGLDALRDSGGVLEVVIPEAGTTGHQRELRRRLENELER